MAGLTNVTTRPTSDACGRATTLDTACLAALAGAVTLSRTMHSMEPVADVAAGLPD